MGKTGTSSIQKALEKNIPHLAEQKVTYLGMMFDMVDPEVKGQLSAAKVFSQPPETIALYAQRFLAYLQAQAARDGTEVFILSNESLFAQAFNFTPFLEAVRKEIEVRAIGYLRNPYSWLPSAYTQWAIRHKAQPGEIEPFAISAKKLIRQYHGIYIWQEKFSDILSIRSYEANADVVLDFASAAEIDLIPPDRRQLVRGEPAQTVLRALFNNRIPGPVMPTKFNRAVRIFDGRKVASVRDVATRCFDYSEVAAVIGENQEVFEFVRDNLGFDFFGPAPSTPIPPDLTELQQRLIDHLVEITFDQAKRLERLERQVEDLSRDQ